MTSAMLAAKKGREAQLQVLADYMAGKEVTFKNHQGAVRPFTATYDPEEESKERSPVKLHFDKVSIFLDAAAQSDDALVEKMLESKEVDPNVCNADGLTALHQACIENSQKVINILLNHGADVNRKDNDWWTPVHAAAACSHWRVINLLISHGADITAVNADGDLPIDIAEGNKVKQILSKEYETLGLSEDDLDTKREAEHAQLKQIVTEMIEAKEDLNAKDENGVTLLHAAASNGWEDLVEELINQQVEMDPTDADGDTPLLLAVNFAHYKTVELLAEGGADLHARNRHQEDAMWFAEMLEDGTMVRILKALINKKKASLAPERKRKNRISTSMSYKRKSFAEKQNLKSQNMRQEQEEAKKYAEMEQQGKVGDADASPDKKQKKKSSDSNSSSSSPDKSSSGGGGGDDDAKRKSSSSPDKANNRKSSSSTADAPSLGTMVKRDAKMSAEGDEGGKAGKKKGKKDKKKKEKKKGGGGCTIL